MGKRSKIRGGAGALLLTLLLGLALTGCQIHEDWSHIETVTETAETVVNESSESFGSSSETEEESFSPEDGSDEDTDPDETGEDSSKSGEADSSEGSDESEGSSEAGNGGHSGNVQYAHELPWGAQTPEIPAYSGEARIVLNGNKPYFDTSALTPECYDFYGELDELGRCTGCDAVIGQEIMPTEKRGNISSVHPTGWHTDKYSFVDGESLYNRCHLIAYMFTGQNINEKNLITGTRYMNTTGMNDLENTTCDYIRRTGNHVRYRATPVFEGDNLLASGLILEAWSIEDQGEGICFCIYAYDVQPGVEIDYATGDNWLSGAEPVEEAQETLPTTDPDVEGTYILNLKTKKFHLPTCSGVSDIQEKNKQEYTGSRNQLIEEGYKPCGGCGP